MLEALKEQVFKANCLLPAYGLITFTWGNVSGIDREKGIVAIKPSGVSYENMTAADIVLVDMDGKVAEGTLSPSSDTPTHLEFYKAFPDIAGVTHTHSMYATIFAQAGWDIPSYGTTHADYFYGDIPCTRKMSPEEIATGYEKNTGLVCIKEFEKRGIDPLAIPAVLVYSHGPFTFGKSPEDSVHNAVVLEQVAQMALLTEQLNDGITPMQQELLDKHYLRKHGKNAYYGQK